MTQIIAKMIIFFDTLSLTKKERNYSQHNKLVKIGSRFKLPADWNPGKESC